MKTLYNAKEICDNIRNIVARMLNFPKESITDETSFVELKEDIFTFSVILAEIEIYFHLSNELPADHIMRVGDLEGFVFCMNPIKEKN